ncbi:unnamed protein product [Closterium sp. NIES-64]|nr:unnamed protein product [Closterium sp. NIES-65]CAI5966964.1 unnamed protein product [Closterium sp. NIES-64]CAI5978124.1 unnamed protein product [Closterium sp. NIES-65]
MATYGTRAGLGGSGISGGGGASEIPLWQGDAEREQYESFADLYAIIKTTEKLEKAYVRDLISPADYEPACAKLIGQFRTLRTALQGAVPDIERFMTTYKMDCPAAKNRLLVAGVPATVEHKSATVESGSATVAVAETVQHFITAMDTVKLNMLAVDQVHPLLSLLLNSLCSVPSLPAEFEGRTKVRDWLVRLNSMAASDELSEEQARQLSFDLESSYSVFMQSLGIKN